ncbi:hypothetical protein B484DRAFT_408459 [Ochromonadaceae sp. CCMP2298]|nr:hypothetical protein B484DRAFT_408459 [Ochromonadaceae sp. CCMP2298]
MIAPSSALAGREQYRKAFYKRTRRGKVVQIVQERYLRSDLDCGVMHGALLTASALRDVVAQAPHRQLLVVDTNIALHQIDLLEFSCPATALLVLTQTVLQELKHLNVSVFRRVLELAKDEKRSFIFFANEFAASTAAPR